jgi:hypothetical protein
MCLCLIGALVLSESVSSVDLSEHAKAQLRKAGLGTPDSARVVYRDSAYSKYEIVDIGKGDFVHVQQNLAYITVSSPFPESNIRERLVISQMAEWVIGNWEGNAPWLEAKATLVDSSGSSRILWSLSEEADEGRVERDLYRTVRYGCCGSLDVSRLHRLRDGVQLMSYTDSIARYTVNVDGQPSERFIGGLGSGSYLQWPFSEDSLAMAALSYVSEDSCIHILLIRAKRMDVMMRQDQCGLGRCLISLVSGDTVLGELNRHPDIWYSTSPSARSSAHTSERIIKVAFDCDIPVFIIPLRGDDFALDRTDFPDYEIIRIR